ncbi:hypothetical protein AB0K52_20555 [Glycomyces sp. NPDC049804]|uniref:hypothetical protein n=1 Tax=Glycomyces sp. NPDC049804 TaxID=3154363 RepID=UPI0034141B42
MSYPPPPPAPPPGPPLGAAPESMPGSTKGAVVLLWILFGLGICGSGALAFSYSLLSTLEEQGDVVIPSSYVPYLVVAIVQAVIWTVLRAVFAVKIAKRSAGARKGAVIFEIINVGLALLSWIFAPQVEYTGAEPAGGAAGGLIGAVIGIAMAAVIIGLLSTADSKRWCNE